MSEEGTGTSLVLGASGFIGRWVVRELLRRRNAVVAAVRSESMGAFGSWSIRPALAKADLARPGEAGRIVTEAMPLRVFNLAGYGVDRRERDPELAARLNHRLVEELGESCAEMPPDTRPVVVHVGSALEYGVAGGVLSESTPPQPTTLYGETKLAGTLALRHISVERSLRGVTARLFTVFGDGEHEGRLFPTLVSAARSGKGAAIPLSAGTQRRDFAWAGDIAALIVDLSEADFERGAIVNVASGVMHPVGEFAVRCANKLGIAEDLLRFGAIPMRPEEMEHEGVDVGLLRQLVGRSALNLAEAIARAVQTPLPI